MFFTAGNHVMPEDPDPAPQGLELAPEDPRHAPEDADPEARPGPRRIALPAARSIVRPVLRPVIRPAIRPLAIAIAAVAIQFAMVTAYAWSATSTAPRNVPVAITGPAKAVAAVTGAIDLARPGAFRLIPVATPQLASASITSRQAYGAIILPAATASPSASAATSAGTGTGTRTRTGTGAGTGTPEVLVASGASPAIANILTSLAGHLGGAGTTTPTAAGPAASGPAAAGPATAAPAATIRDVVPTSAADPNGTGFAFTVLPIAISSLIAGAILTLGIRSRQYRAAALIVFGIGGGLASVAVAHTWLGIVPGSFPVLAVVAGLAALAAAAAVSGLAQACARFAHPSAGIAIGGALIMLAGNPFSGAAGAPEMLPGAWGMVGQCLPNGALATLLRSVAYFDGARSAGPWIVLAFWTAAGLLLTLAVRPRRPALPS